MNKLKLHLKENLIFEAFMKVLPVTVLVIATALMFGISAQVLPGQAQVPDLKLDQQGGPLTAWDPEMEWYLVERGYQPYDWLTAKQPFFMGLVRLVMLVTKLPIHQVMFWVSKLGLQLCLMASWLLLTDLFGKETAGRLVWFLPASLLGTGFVFMMSFPEPWHIFFWVLAFRQYLRKDDVVSSAFSALAILTRPQSVLVVIAIGLGVLIRELRSGLWLKRGLRLCVLPTLVWAGWLAFISKITLTPLATITAQNYYGRGLKVSPFVVMRNVIEQLLFLPNHMRWGDWFEVWHLILIAAGILILTWQVSKKTVPFELWIFSVGSWILPMATDEFAIGRFMIATWLPFALAAVVPKGWDKVAIVFGFILSFWSMTVLTISSGPNWAGYIP